MKNSYKEAGIKEEDVDWNAVALAFARELNIDSFSNACVTDFGDRREHVYRNMQTDTDVRIDVDGKKFKVFTVYQPWNNPAPKLIKSGRISDLSIFSIKRFLNSALRHGLDSDPDHEVGDLQEYLRSMWSLLTPEQKLEFVQSESVLSTLSAAEVEDIEDLGREAFRQ